jgi:phasin family protein
MDGSEAIKTNVDRATAAGTQAFKEGVERSLSTFNELNVAQKRNLEAVVESVTAAAKGAEALGAQTLAFTKKSWEDQVNAAQALSSAKSVQDVVELQTQFAKTAIEAYLAEMNRWTETVSSTVKDSWKPLNERVTASVERLQATR